MPENHWLQNKSFLQLSLKKWAASQPLKRNLDILLILWLCFLPTILYVREAGMFGQRDHFRLKRKFWLLKLTVCLHKTAKSFVSKDQGKFFFHQITHWLWYFELENYPYQILCKYKQIFNILLCFSKIYQIKSISKIKCLENLTVILI